MAHNWQNSKRVFLLCYCQGRSSWSKKFQLFLKNFISWEYGKFGAISWKNQYFANKCLIKVRIWEFFCTHVHVLHITVNIFHTSIFVSNKLIFSWIHCTHFPSKFCVFSAKSWSITQRSVSRENAYKKSYNPLPFLCKTIDSNNSFTLIESKFQVFKLAKLEFKVPVHYGLWAKYIHLWPRKLLTSQGHKKCLIYPVQHKNHSIFYKTLYLI